MVWICVGTPSAADSGINLRAVETVVRQIGEWLATTSQRPLIVVRSTVLPGTAKERLIPLLEATSGLTVGQDVHLVSHPEFLREGTAVLDFDNPPKILIGEDQPGTADLLVSLYATYEAPLLRLECTEAEMVKYADNLFHAVKITYANEIGLLARALGVDARRVMEAVKADTKLNISPAYLQPGFSFGGSCLPKDTRAILRQAAIMSVRLPMLSGVLDSNDAQIGMLVNRILSHAPGSVGMVGLAFKADTDDMRESPYVTVAKRLIGEGIEVSIFDPGVDPDRLIGSNRDAVQAALGHLGKMLVSSLSGFAGCDLIVVNHRRVDSVQVEKWLADGKVVFDLAGIPDVEPATGYVGIAW